MRRLVGVIAGVAGAAAGVGAAAPAWAMPPMDAAGASVSILARSFGPDHTDVLAGDEVHWENASALRHTVQADDGSFASGDLFGGDMYARRFDTPGAVAYHCTLHPFMRGEVDVRRVLLSAPRAPAAPGRPYLLSGRAAVPAGTAVAIERDDGGAGFVPVADAVVGDDEAFTARVRTGGDGVASYRAVAAGEASPAVRLRVVDRHVTATASRVRGGRSRVTVRVAPASRGATVVLQLHLREHFGWWPVRRARLDRASRARFTVHPGRKVRARVVLTLADGATVLTSSRELRVGRRGAATRRHRRSRHGTMHHARPRMGHGDGR